MPATKGKSLTALNYHSSVALTSVIMKTFDHIVKSEVLYAVCDMLKSTQFAFRAHRERAALLKHCTKWPGKKSDPCMFAFY